MPCHEVQYQRIIQKGIAYKMKEKIKEKFNADCCEMEGAAIAQVCYLNRVPFLVIRSISDVPNGKNHIDFDKFIKLASKNCAQIIQKIC